MATLPSRAATDLAACLPLCSSVLREGGMIRSPGRKCQSAIWPDSLGRCRTQHLSLKERHSTSAMRSSYNYRAVQAEMNAMLAQLAIATTGTV